MVLGLLRAQVGAMRNDPRFVALAAEVAAGSTDAYSAGQALLSERD